MTLLFVADAKHMKEVAEPKLVTSVLPWGSGWLGKRQRGRKAFCFPLFLSTSPHEDSASWKGRGGGGRQTICLMVSGQTTC